jgi:hypothetical protein
MGNFQPLRLTHICYISVNRLARQDWINGGVIMTRIEKIALCAVLASTASPAFATEVGAPAPVAGIGIGAVALIGLGYRALKRRLHP